MREEYRQIVYKRVGMAMPHCSVCKEQLSGNNSKIMPYRCSCGEWEYVYDYDNFAPGFFRIKA